MGSKHQGRVGRCFPPGGKHSYISQDQLIFLSEKCVLKSLSPTWCFWIVVLEKTLENPLGSKDIKPVNPKGNQPWIFIGSVDTEPESPILCPPHAKSWLIVKDPDARKDWGQEEKRATEDEMVGWHHWLNGHEFEQTKRDIEGQGSLACCSPWGHKELDMTERLNNNPILWEDLVLSTWVQWHRGCNLFTQSQKGLQSWPCCLPAALGNIRSSALPLLILWGWPGELCASEVFLC